MKFKETKDKFYSNSVISNGEVTNQKSSTKRKNQVKMAKSKNLIRLKN